jgi:hypothetical protein
MIDLACIKRLIEAHCTNNGYTYTTTVQQASHPRSSSDRLFDKTVFNIEDGSGNTYVLDFFDRWVVVFDMERRDETVYGQCNSIGRYLYTEAEALAFINQCLPAVDARIIPTEDLHSVTEELEKNERELEKLKAGSKGRVDVSRMLDLDSISALVKSACSASGYGLICAGTRACHPMSRSSEMVRVIECTITDNPAIRAILRFYDRRSEPGRKFPVFGTCGSISKYLQTEDDVRAFMSECVPGLAAQTAQSVVVRKLDDDIEKATTELAQLNWDRTVMKAQVHAFIVRADVRSWALDLSRRFYSADIKRIGPHGVETKNEFKAQVLQMISDAIG